MRQFGGIVDNEQPECQDEKTLTWAQRIKATIVRMRKEAAKNNEPRSITLARINAARNHDPEAGDYFCVIIEQEDGKPTLFIGDKID